MSSGPYFGTRESRHVNAVYQLTYEDVAQKRRFPDAVALGACPVEYHPDDGGDDVWRDIRDRSAYEIPLGTLCSVDTANLFAAGRVVDGDSYVDSSMRVMMGTAFATGRAVGVAAAQCADAGRLDAAAVRAELVRQAAVLSIPTGAA